MTKTPCGRQTDHRYRARGRGKRRLCGGPGHGRRNQPGAGIGHRPVPQRPEEDPCAGPAPEGQREDADHQGSPGQQPEEHRCVHSPGNADSGYRGQRQRQKYPDQRYPVQGPGQEADGGPGTASGPRTDHRDPAYRQGYQHRPEPHWPDSPVQPGHLHRHIRPDPDPVQHHQRRQAPGLQAGPVQLQREGGAV